MQSKFPKYLERFLDLIINFDKKVNKIKGLHLLTWDDFSELFESATEILDEYWAIIQAYSLDEKKLKDLQKDIWGLFDGIIYNDKGKVITWSKGIGFEEVKIKILQLISTFRPFINSRVYLTLLEAYEKLLKRENLLGEFVRLSQYRGGRYKPQEQKKDMDSFMIGDDKEKEKK